MVYYRKYRPQNISELDLAAVREKLSSILSAKEIPHAFLFTGPKGLGKTSSARILAKAINCENKKGIEPCNKCDACISITNGSNLDVIEIDAASNRGIDEIRDLREKIKFLPSSLPKKVYIIDEVHMLTTDAFNALLKTLEEPPNHAIFILCTTEVEKVPATISSRTFHVQFQKPNKDELAHSLARMVKGENLEVEKSVLEQIFSLSEGSFRDAAKILEELNLAAKDGKITKEVMESSYKTESTDAHVRKLLDALSKKDLGESMKVIDSLAQGGADFKVVMEKIAAALHAMIMTRAKVAVTPFDIPEFSDQEVKELLESVNATYRDLKFAVLPQIPLELVAVDYCLAKGISNNEEGIRSEKKEEVKKEEVRQEEKVESTTGKDELSKPQETPVVHEQKSVPPEPMRSEQNDSDLFVKSSKPEVFLAAFLTTLKRDNHSIAGILRGCRLVEIRDGEVIFETKYKFHKDKLNEAKIREVLDRRASELLTEQVRVIVNLSGK